MSVLDADRRFFDALIAADREALTALLHDQFLIVDVNAGNVTGREAFLAFVASGQVRFERIDTSPGEAAIRQFGDTAIVVGRTDMRFVLPDGTVFASASRYTHVFVAGDAPEDWRLVSAQGTALPAAKA